MKKITLTLSIVFLIGLQFFANPISIDAAKKVAKNFLFENESIIQNDLKLSNAIVFEDQTNLFYIFNFKDIVGFIIVSATDNYTPIIAYSTESYYNTEKQAPQFVNLMEKYTKQIKYTIVNNVKANKNTNSQWLKYNCLPQNFTLNKTEKSVSPLLDPIAWDQGYGWNGECPIVSGGPGGRAYAGCVATAQGQAMKYWEHPSRGFGEHSYWTMDYGILSVNFSEATYNWSSMPNTTYSTATATLLYHCGVSVNMNYQADGSGAFTQTCETSLESFFRYKETAEYIEKVNYTDTEWITILKNELDNDRVMIYSGHSPQFGHAFNCDGYNSSDLFHFNFGWSGYDNGYYTLTSVNGFNDDQGAVIGIEPDFNYVPENLTAATEGKNVILNWEVLASTNNSLSGFYVFRDDVQLGDMIPSTSLTYSDNNLDDGTYTYCIKAVYDTDITECSNTESVNINSINVKNVYSKISIFPNPTSDFINIDFAQNQKYNIQIVDIYGKVLINKMGENHKLALKISNFAKGIYIININLENTSFRKKVILQ